MLLALAACRQDKPADEIPPLSDLIAANRALSAHLPRPTTRWRVPGAWSHQSIFDTEPDGPVLLALSSTKDRLDLLAIDWKTGATKWRAPLPHREPPALTAVAGLALAHDINHNLAAFDLKTGHALWTRKLDCEIAPGHLDAVHDGLLLALCTRAEHGRVVALDPNTGATRWTHTTSEYSQELYADQNHAYFPQQIVNRGSPREGWPDFPILTGSRWRIEWLQVDVASGSVDETLVVPNSQPKAATGTKWLSAFSRKDAQGLWDVVPLRALHLYRSEEEPLCTYGWPNGGCIPDYLHRVRHVIRAGRWFDIRCDRVIERDARGAEAQSFPIPRLDDLSPSSVAAIDVLAGGIVLLLASYHDALPGRIVVVHPDGHNDVMLAPVLDTNVVAIHDGLLVAQEAADLVAYSVLDSRPGSETPNHLRQVRGIVRGRGRIEHRQCEKAEFFFDDLAAASLTQIPGWEQHLAALFFNPDAGTRDGALAAAVRLKSRTMARVLISVLTTENAPQSFPIPVHEPQPRFHIHWAADPAYLRTLAVMALVTMSYGDAAPALAKHALRSPLPGYDHVSGCSSDIAAICDFLNHSDSPQAHQAIASYDTAAGAEGAFKSLCEKRLY